MFAFASSNVYAEGKKIIKWVDKNGVTQYGDRLPMPDKASKASVLSKQGVTVDKIEQTTSKNTQDEALATQTRRDNALLGSYNSVEEIDIARKRNTKIDEMALATLLQKHQLLNEQLAQNNNTLLEFAKKKKVAPAENVAMVEKNLEDIAKVEQDIATKKQVIAEINQRYAADKARYNELDARKGKLQDIKYANKDIAELEKWRDDAQSKVDSYEAQIVTFKRSGSETPTHIKTGLLNATKELDRANADLAASRAELKENKAELSK